MEISGIRMLIGLLIGIAVLILLMLKTKIQAFLALILSTILVGVIGGMPLIATDIVDAAGEFKSGVSIVNSITGGFGGTLGSIGIIIGFGVMMGQIFEVSGAAKRMAHTFLKLFGKGKEEIALALTGFLVSIPIFCDSGFVVLSPIAKALSRTTKKSVIGLGAALSGSPDSRSAGCLRYLRRKRRRVYPVDDCPGPSHGCRVYFLLEEVSGKEVLPDTGRGRQYCG